MRKITLWGILAHFQAFFPLQTELKKISGKNFQGLIQSHRVIIELNLEKIPSHIFMIDQSLRKMRENAPTDATPLNKIVLEWSIYPTETVKIRFGSSLNFTSKNWLSPIINKCNISKSIHFCNGLPYIKQSQNGPSIPQKA